MQHILLFVSSIISKKASHDLLYERDEGERKKDINIHIRLFLKSHKSNTIILYMRASIYVYICIVSVARGIIMHDSRRSSSLFFS